MGITCSRSGSTVKPRSSAARTTQPPLPEHTANTRTLEGAHAAQLKALLLGSSHPSSLPALGLGDACAGDDLIATLARLRPANPRDEGAELPHDSLTNVELLLLESNSSDVLAVHRAYAAVFSKALQQMPHAVASHLQLMLRHGRVSCLPHVLICHAAPSGKLCANATLPSRPARERELSGGSAVGVQEQLTTPSSLDSRTSLSGHCSRLNVASLRSLRSSHSVAATFASATAAATTARGSIATASTAANAASSAAVVGGADAASVSGGGGVAVASNAPATLAFFDADSSPLWKQRASGLGEGEGEGGISNSSELRTRQRRQLEQRCWEQLPARPPSQGQLSGEPSALSCVVSRGLARLRLRLFSKQSGHGSGRRSSSRRSSGSGSGSPNAAKRQSTRQQSIVDPVPTGAEIAAFARSRTAARIRDWAAAVLCAGEMRWVIVAVPRCSLAAPDRAEAAAAECEIVVLDIGGGVLPAAAAALNGERTEANIGGGGDGVDPSERGCSLTPRARRVNANLAAFYSVFCVSFPPPSTTTPAPLAPAALWPPGRPDNESTAAEGDSNAGGLRAQLMATAAPAAAITARRALRYSPPQSALRPAAVEPQLLSEKDGSDVLSMFG